MPFPPIDKSFEGVIKELTARLGLVERKLRRKTSDLPDDMEPPNIVTSSTPGLKIVTFGPMSTLPGGTIQVGGGYTIMVQLGSTFTQPPFHVSVTSDGQFTISVWDYTATSVRITFMNYTTAPMTSPFTFNLVALGV